MSDEFKLGDQEAIVLRAVYDLPQERAYGAPIMDYVTEATGKELALGTIYVVLARLEEKGFVTHRNSDPTPERGGRSKKLYKIEASGQRALSQKANELRRRSLILLPPEEPLGGLA